jgi:hypothetical protein
MVKYQASKSTSSNINGEDLMQYVIYIIPAAVVVIIFLYGLMSARKKMAQFQNPGGADAASPQARQNTPPAPAAGPH